MKQLSLPEEEILTEKVKKFPVLYGKTDEGHKKTDVLRNIWKAVVEDLDLAENGKFCLTFNVLT